MKEFASQTGGRYTYIDDMMNLQDLALSFASIFSGCGNFIISGCQVTGNAISAGYVYINGKIRYCSGTSSVPKWPTYVYESNYSEKVPYADSSDKVGRKTYGCAIASSVPTSNDTLTGRPPQSICINADGSAPRLQDAFIGKYGLLLNPSKTSQAINKPVMFNGMLTANSGITSKNDINLVRGNAKASMSYNASGALTIQSVVSNRTYKLTITENGEFQFYVNNVLLGTVNETGTSLKVAVASDTVKGGNLVLTNNHFYNGGVAADDAAININVWGYNGGLSYFRNTNIGDGKGNIVMSITGSTKDVIFNGPVNIAKTDVALTFSHPTLSKTDKSLALYNLWRDENGDELGVMGYTTKTDFNWHIKNNIGAIQFDNDVYVTGSLYAKGVSILDSFVSNNTFKTSINQKANAADVYSKTESDKRFIKLTDSIDVFVTQAGGGEAGKKAVRTAIGASSINDFNNTLHLDQGFKDIVAHGLPASTEPGYATKLESRKRLLCSTLGAAFFVDIDKRYLKRSDDISVFVTNAGGGLRGQTTVCNTIGACTINAFSQAALKSEGFQDIVSFGLSPREDSYASKLDARKRALCKTIGAAYASDFSAPIKDTGWIPVTVQDSSVKLYVRQVGHVVSIQGQLHTNHSGTIFTLPNQIDPPTYEIGYSHNKAGHWHCVIKGGSRDCKVDSCSDGCSENIGFLMTYIV